VVVITDLTAAIPGPFLQEQPIPPSCLIFVVVVPLSVFFCSVLLSPLNLSILHFSFP
jgi:hypothetical protein